MLKIVKAEFHVTGKRNGAALADFLLDLLAQSWHRSAIQVELGRKCGCLFLRISGSSRVLADRFFHIIH